MSDEWGPWVEHDGKGCPCVGQWVMAVGYFSTGETQTHEGICRRTDAWDWNNFGKIGPEGLIGMVIRYRIRKPRGLTILQKLIENLPEPEREKTPA